MPVTSEPFVKPACIRICTVFACIKFLKNQRGNPDFARCNPSRKLFHFFIRGLQNVFEFLESLSGTGGEANVKTLLGNRDTLERNVSYYFTAKKEESDSSRYLALIRKSLKTILSNIKKTLTAIDYTIRDS